MLDKAKIAELAKEIEACALELDYEGIGRSGNCLREAVEPLLRLARAAVDDGEFPAFLTHSQAWPQGYVHGFNDALLLVRQQGFGPRVDDDTLREFKGVALRADAADTTAGDAEPEGRG